MNYVSFRFWILLAVLLGTYGVIRLVLGGRWRGEWDRWYLLAASFTLFATESLLSFGIFLAVGAWIYAIVFLLPAIVERFKWPLVLAAVAVALQPLAYYKYWSPDRASVLIPIGISFYTFQMIGLLVDTARQPGSRLPLRDFFNFASFFPQIVAGPIERRASLLPQLRAFRFRIRRAELEAGVRLVVIGLFYKLVAADNLAASSGWIVWRLESPWLIHLSNLLFGLRIYFDFCGYSLIALGIGRALGVKLTVNFLSPYTRRNVQEFWRTWHVSLSQWFRDYVYVPLGGRGAKFPVVVIMVVFLVSGVWHGAGLNFVLWGGVHGLFLVVFRMAHGRLAIPAILSWALTMGVVTTSWLFFYQLDAAVIGEKLARLADPRAYLAVPFGELIGLVRNPGNVAYLGCAATLGMAIVALEFISRKKSGSPYAWGRPNLVQAIMVILMVWTTPVGDNGFVYFNF